MYVLWYVRVVDTHSILKVHLLISFVITKGLLRDYIT